MTVRASETMHGRARLTARAADAPHAADALREGTRRRLARRLGLAVHADADEIADAAADRLRIPRGTLQSLLSGPPPTDDAALVALARRLDELETAVETSAQSRGAAHDHPSAPHPFSDRSRGDPVTDENSPVDDAALRQAMHRVRTEVDKAVVGQAGTVTGLLVSLLARGHVLLEGVPGVAKTLVVRSFARALGLDTKRVQFTPDLMPGDVTGSLVYDARTGSSTSARAPCSRTSCLRTRSTARPEDPGGAPGGDGGASGLRGRREPRCPTRSSSPRRRTPSSTRGPTLCPKPNSTAS